MYLTSASIVDVIVGEIPSYAVEDAASAYNADTALFRSGSKMSEKSLRRGQAVKFPKGTKEQ